MFSRGRGGRGGRRGGEKGVRPLFAVLCVAILAAGGSGSAGQNRTGQATTSRVSFNRDVRPIMSGTCFRCHGPDESSRRADMRLDIRDEALKTRRNGTPIVPGRPEASLIITRIFAEDPSRVMPPAAIHKELTAAQKDYRLFPLLIATFPCFHIGYGYGFLRGICDFIILRRKPGHRFTLLTRTSTRFP